MDFAPYWICCWCVCLVLTIGGSCWQGEKAIISRWLWRQPTNKSTTMLSNNQCWWQNGHEYERKNQLYFCAIELWSLGLENYPKDWEAKRLCCVDSSRSCCKKGKWGICVWKRIWHWRYYVNITIDMQEMLDQKENQRYDLVVFISFDLVAGQG